MVELLGSRAFWAWLHEEYTVQGYEYVGLKVHFSILIKPWPKKKMFPTAAYEHLITRASKDQDLGEVFFFPRSASRFLFLFLGPLDEM